MDDSTLELIDTINLYAVEHEHTEGVQLEEHTYLNGETIRLRDQLTDSTVGIIEDPAKALPLILAAMRRGEDIVGACHPYDKFLKKKILAKADPNDEPLDKGFPEGSCGGMGCMAADCVDCNPVTREVYLSKYVTREEFDAMTKRASERITNFSQATDTRFKTLEQIVKSQSKPSPIDKVEKL
jgi:hypothetical protein